MITLSEIESKLREIALSNNLTGDLVELLIKLIAYSRYESEVSTYVSLLEALPSRAANENSKIEHAVNNMYSIFRGENSILELEVKVTGNITLNSLQLVFSNRFDRLYFKSLITPLGKEVSGDYDLVYGNVYKLRLIKSNSIESVLLSTDVDNAFLLESLVGNISETYILKNRLNNFNLKTTKSFSDHIDSSIEGGDLKHFDLTIPDYGVRFYSADPLGFSISDPYELLYAPFLEEDIRLDLLNKMTIEGVDIDFNSLKIIPFKEKEVLYNYLYNLNKNLLVQSKVRSNSDVLDSFRNLFTSKILDCSLESYDIDDNKLTISYIPLSPELNPSPLELVDSDLSLYKNGLMYYVTKNIDLVPRYENESGVNIYINVDFYIVAPLDISKVIKHLKAMEYRLGGMFSKDKLLGFLNNLEGVKYVSLEAKDSLGNEVSEINLPNTEFFLVSNNFTYSLKS